MRSKQACTCGKQMLLFTVETLSLCGTKDHDFVDHDANIISSVSPARHLVVNAVPPITHAHIGPYISIIRYVHDCAHIGNQG